MTTVPYGRVTTVCSCRRCAPQLLLDPLGIHEGAEKLEVPDRQLRRMRDRKFVPFHWERHWVRAFSLAGDSWASWDLFPPVKGYRPAPSDNRTYYISLARQHRDWSRTVIERDGGCCQQCRATEHLEAHHLWPQGWSHHLRYILRHGVTLCRSCHASAAWYTELSPNQFRWLTADTSSINANIERDDFWEYFTAGQQKGRLRLYGIETEEIDWRSPENVEQLEWYKSLAKLNGYVERVEQLASTGPVPDPEVRLDLDFVREIELHDPWRTS